MERSGDCCSMCYLGGVRKVMASLLEKKEKSSEQNRRRRPQTRVGRPRCARCAAKRRGPPPPPPERRLSEGDPGIGRQCSRARLDGALVRSSVSPRVNASDAAEWAGAGRQHAGRRRLGTRWQPLGLNAMDPRARPMGYSHLAPQLRCAHTCATAARDSPHSLQARNDPGHAARPATPAAL